MEVIDVNGTKRNAISVTKVVFGIPNALNGEIIRTEEYAEVMIVGKTGRKWLEWYPLEAFIIANPEIKVMKNGSDV